MGFLDLVHQCGLSLDDVLDELRRILLTVFPDKVGLDFFQTRHTGFMQVDQGLVVAELQHDEIGPGGIMSVRDFHQKNRMLLYIFDCSDCSVRSSLEDG